MMLWIALLLVGGLSAGQEQTGSLAGTARDPSGAPIPGVAITVSSPGERVAITNIRGEYRFERLLPGTWRASAKLAGFFEVETFSIAIEAGRTADWSPVMRVLPIRGMDALTTFVRSFTGPQAAECGRHPVAVSPEALTKSLACAMEASAQRRPFWTFKEDPGIDSRLAHGLLGDSDGAVFRFHWDSAPCGGPGCAPRYSIESCPVPGVGIGSRFVCKR
jgi:hypothetical protein